MVLWSAERSPWYCHGKRCIWPSCSVKLSPHPTCMEPSSANSLMRLSQESISCKGSNVLLRGCRQTCAACQFDILTSLRTHHLLYSLQSSKLRQPWVAEMSVRLWLVTQERALQVEHSQLSHPGNHFLKF